MLYDPNPHLMDLTTDAPADPVLEDADSGEGMIDFVDPVPLEERIEPRD